MAKTKQVVTPPKVAVPPFITSPISTGCTNITFSGYLVPMYDSSGHVTNVPMNHISWDPVTGATDYAIYVTDPNGKYFQLGSSVPGTDFYYSFLVPGWTYQAELHVYSPSAVICIQNFTFTAVSL